MSGTAIPRLPGGVPGLGHALALRRDPFGLLLRARAWGDVVEIGVGPRPVYVINSPRVIRQILVSDAAHYDKGSLFEKASAVLGNGVVTSSGEFHRQQRRLIHPAFQSTRIPLYAEVMTALAEELSQAWQPGRHLRMDAEMHRLTITTAARTLFSSRLADHAVTEIQHSLPVFLSTITARALSPVPLLEKLPTPGNRRFARARQRMLRAVLSVIDDYRAVGGDQGDLLSMLLAARDADSGRAMPREQVYDEAVTFMVAASESTATALSWAFHYLGNHRAVEERVRREVRDCLGERAAARHGDLPRLARLRQVLHEVLRLHPLALLPRRALQDVEVDGRHYPRGTQFFISPHALHRDRRHYAAPADFDPDRWAPDRAPHIDPETYLPFGVGRHGCLGESFAWSSMTITLATLLNRFSFTPVPGHRIREVMAGTSRPCHLPMIVHPC
ncbi:cytochrome P450 [Streptomyces poonensis]|uniref:Cytochrome P450 n=1 Tax=Streptomyces poonensis TaxID=68255 RepID=A0A918UG63_9ACTN|nr:cytochrome P450 [Streptomyces poonensis]GGZ03911.1 cytochrome P450 [Streptomyces poonensis]GLJ90791.1 cytochrome P450 [Streptomyces poonensis]